MKVIIYPIENSIAVMAPSGVLSIEEVAKKDVPIGVPYLIVDAQELPDTPQETWMVDFSAPAGFGGGVKVDMEKLAALQKLEARELFKQERAKAVAAIVVEVDGLLFDGDEVAQTRMARAALVMQEGETTTWVQANNIPAEVTKEQLIEAIRLAGAEQTRLWVMPSVAPVEEIEE